VLGVLSKASLAVLRRGLLSFPRIHIWYLGLGKWKGGSKRKKIPVRVPF
jgi:hypothetical protein